MDLKSLAQNLAHSKSLLDIYYHYHPTTTMTTTSQWEIQHSGIPALSSPSFIPSVFQELLSFTR